MVHVDKLKKCFGNTPDSRLNPASLAEEVQEENLEEKCTTKETQQTRTASRENS